MILSRDNKISNISQNQIKRMAYARDASIYRLFPKSITYPKNIKDIKALFSSARSTKIPITFRAAGTSLSGQSLGYGTIVEILNYWQKFKIINNGESIQMQPGLNAGFVNKILEPYQRKIGPDPASIKAASIGGIISNNSSGMICGTEYNSYHTLKNLEFILPNGNDYNTSNPGENQKFINDEPVLAKAIIQIRQTILNNKILIDKIRNKYRIKNTIGYSMNSFIDYKKPLEIFSHLLIGSEGTLAFISSVTLNTIPDPPLKGTGLIIFNTPEEAGNSVGFFKQMGASAVELLDDASLKTAFYLKNAPYNPKTIELNDTALLVEYQNESIKEIDYLLKETKYFSEKEASVKSIKLVKNEIERDAIWKIRKGLYPTLSSLRESGLSIINEDFAVDIENLGPAIRNLKNIFEKYNYDDGVIFGHAKDGNLHFIVSENLEGKGLNNYEGLINDFSEMTINDFNGSLKAEHGTGRNMAPFVEKEWGGEIYKLMWKLKLAVDPQNILNPDVILSKDKSIHLKNLKLMPKIHDEVDKCIECGFCERICPSRGLTLTPRQRISVLREIETENFVNYSPKELAYHIDSSCVTDGLCSMECPVNINTGEMIKTIRNPNEKDPWIVEKISKNFKEIIALTRFGLKSANLIGNIIGRKNIYKISKKINILSNGKILALPKVGLKLSNNICVNKHNSPDVIHFPSCINRVICSDKSGISSSDLLSKIIKYAGLKVATLDNYNEYCCGMSFDSKGYKKTGSFMRDQLLNKLNKYSKNGEIPVVIDMSPCNQFLNEILIKNNIYDSVQYLNKIKTKLKFKKNNESIFVHEVCSSQKNNDNKNIYKLAKFCSSSIEKATEGFCCGSGGDRGFKYPELVSNSINRSINNVSSKIGVSSSRTCEVGLSNNLNIDFISIEALVYKSLKK